jgi:hypothetical protein
VRFLLVAVAALVFTGAASADTTFTDATGEDAAAADLSTVVVSNDPAAHTFKIAAQVANMPTLETNAGVVIAFDSDRNASTGQSGLDYLFAVDSGGWSFNRWDGTQWADVPAVNNVAVNYANGLLTAVFHESDIAAVQAFTFVVVTARGTDPANPTLDTAGPWTYTLATLPVAKPATVRSSSVTVLAPPRAGARFRIGPFAVNLSDGTSINATGEKCTATLGGVRLKGAGAGGCTFTLPKTATKKRLAVRVSGAYGGSTISKTVTYVVR